MNKLWETNKIGLLAFIFTTIGVATTIIPFLGFIAFFTLPAGLVLGIISVAKKNQPKWLGISSIIASSVSILANIIVFTLIVTAVIAFLIGLIQNV